MLIEDLPVRPDSSSENIKNPLFISAVLGPKILDVAGLGRGDCTEFPNSGSAVTVNSKGSVDGTDGN